jgi:hypothetical protein
MENIQIHLYKTGLLNTDIQRCVTYRQLRELVASLPHSGGPGSILGQVIRDLLWTEWYRRRSSANTSVSPTNSRYTQCCTLVHHPGLAH